MNNHQIEFTGQTKAMVKINNKTIDLQLLITKATTSPLMGLDWVQRLGIHLNADNIVLQRHNIQLDDTGRKIAQLKNDFKDLFYNHREIKDLSVKMNPKGGAQIIQ